MLKILIFSISLALAGCANYASRIRSARSLYEGGEFDKSIEILKELVKKQDNDQLLFLMDLGTVYHAAGRYREAIETFQQADGLAEIKDYTSLSQEAGSILLSDEVKPYKGEDFEKILIHVYLAMDYTLLQKWEDALVECRRVNHKLDLMISQGGLPYEHNAFAKYLAAVLFEAMGEINDAFVDYRMLLKWKVDFPYLGISLLRMADRLKAMQEFEEYRKKYSAVSEFRIAKGEGEVILLLEQGKAPIKVPSPQWRLLPTFQKRFYASDYVWLNVGTRRMRTHSLFDVETTAIKELDHKISLIAAKKMAGVVAKEIVANQVAKQTKNKGLGVLTSLILHATDQADLRSWTTLPAKLQLVRLAVPAGRYFANLDRVDQGGVETKGVKKWDDVEVKAGRMTFLNYRMLD